MNSDYVKGTMDDVAGRAKRQAGEWTGDTNAQLEGLTQQLKGKAEKAWGTVKEAVQGGQSAVQAQATKAREIVDGKARDGKEEVERRRQQADRLHDQCDVDPAYQDGKEQGEKRHGPLVTEEPQETPR